MRQECHNSKFAIFQEKFLKLLKCYNFFVSATTTQLLSSGEFCKMCYDTIPVKSASETILSIPVTQKCQILSSDTLVANGRYMNVLPDVSDNLHKTLQTLLVSFLCKILNNLLKYLKLRSTKHKCNRIYTSKYKIIYEHCVPQLQ